MNFNNVNLFDSPEILASTLATKIIELVKGKNGEPFHLALSGGSTPKLLFAELALQCKHILLPNLHLWWSDERCVPPTDDESNYKWANCLWLVNSSINIKNIHRIHGESLPTVEVQRYSDEIKTLVKSSSNFPSFDLILLGLGNDGHTASIFPGFKAFGAQTICFEATHPISNQKRISFSLPLINNAKTIFIMATGIDKSEVIANLFSENEASKAYPVRHVKNNNESTTWFFDKAAFSKLI